LGGAGTRIAVDQGGNEYRTWGGGMFAHGAGTASVGPLSTFGRVNFFLGGGGGGLEGSIAVESYFGGGIPVGSFSQVFLGVGLGARGVKNDELDAISITLPGAMLGYQLAFDGFGLVLAGSGDVTPRTEYAPGDELQGRRAFMRPGTRLGYGGTAALFTRYVFADAGIHRLAMADSPLVVDGSACLSVWYVAACGFGQYWRATVQTAGGTSATVPSLAAGLSLGVGTAVAGGLSL